MTHRFACVFHIPLIVISFAVAYSCCSSKVSHGEETASLTPAEVAAQRGQQWLVARQAANGSWGSGNFHESVAVTAQVVMALVAGGNTPASGEHNEAVAKGIGFCLTHAGPDGLIAAREQSAHGPMYGHAYATLALAEVYGETGRDEEVAKVLVRARNLIERTQNKDGGWRYKPQRQDADASVTAAMVVSLRGLYNSGFAVSEECVDRAVALLERLQNKDGGFRYLVSEGSSGAPRTAASIFALLAANRKSQVTEKGFEWLQQNPITIEITDGYAMYGLLHAAAAHWLRGTDSWSKWYASIEDDLLRNQRADGAWADPSCPEYGTAAAITVLQMSKGLSPLFQRPISDEVVE